MSKRAEREAKALAFVRSRRDASALQIGIAAVRGERWAEKKHVWRAKQEIGWHLATCFVRDGILEATPFNHFRVVQH